jgi:hypothetical protein
MGHRERHVLRDSCLARHNPSLSVGALAGNHTNPQRARRHPGSADLSRSLGEMLSTGLIRLATHDAEQGIVQHRHPGLV